ncbi:MAG: EamA family transporter RarD [Rhodobacteraceae bacterium]|nr:EamA family transporter RarD [Paracoccaceae bacterium]
MTGSQKGFWAVTIACTIWGLSPIFFKVLAHIPASEVLAHRVIWSFVFFGAMLMLQGRLGDVRAALQGWPRLGIFVLASVLISANWFLLIFAIQIGRTTEVSLGFFIFPLVAVLIGRFAFGERLGRLQGVAVLLAALAVGVLTWGLGVAPWISLVMAGTFGIYSAIKKKLAVGPVVSVTCEILLFMPIALGIVALQHTGGQGAFGADMADSVLLILAGPLTALPLVLFSYGARRVTMATIGVMQYINPTLQFLVAVLLFGEAFTIWHQIAFPLIWLGLILFTLASVRNRPAD